MNIAWKGNVSIGVGASVAIIQSGESIDKIRTSSFLQVNNQQLVEIINASVDEANNQIIHLVEPWDQDTVVDQSAIIIPTAALNYTLENKLLDVINRSENLIDANQRNLTMGVATPSTSYTVDVGQGNIVELTLTNPETTIDFVPPDAGAYMVTLLLKQGTGANTATWSNVRWPNDQPPVLSYDQNSFDIISFIVTTNDTFGLVGGGWY